MKVTHAQPLQRGPSGRVAPVPLLTCAEAEVEAEALLLDLDLVSFTRIDELPVPELRGVSLGPEHRGVANLYTHRMTILKAAAHVCHDYLVRIEGDEP